MWRIRRVKTVGPVGWVCGALVRGCSSVLQHLMHSVHVANKSQLSVWFVRCAHLIPKQGRMQATMPMLVSPCTALLHAHPSARSSAASPRPGHRLTRPFVYYRNQVVQSPTPCRNRPKRKCTPCCNSSTHPLHKLTSTVQMRHITFADQSHPTSMRRKSNNRQCVCPRPFSRSRHMHPHICCCTTNQASMA